VWTNLQPATHAAPVQVRVSGPGGAVVGEVILPRGEAARFRVADWAQGPYGSRCVAETAWGGRRVVHLPWFHGDLLRMAQELVDRKQDSANNGTDAATRALLVELIRNRLEAVPLANLDRAEQVNALHAPLMEWAELELERQGTGSRIRPGGFYRIAYVSDVDGSVQFGRAYLPPDYDPARRWPLVVSLHGFNPV